MRNKLGEWLFPRLDRHLLIFLFSACLLIAIYFWRLGAVGYSSYELATVTHAGSFHDITRNPVNAPHDIFLYLLTHFSQHFGHHGAFIMRSVSAAFALIFIYSFYRILRCWFGVFSAWLGTLFFAATPFLILTGRNASAAIMYLWPLTIIAAYMVLIRSRDYLPGRLLLISLLAGLAAYVPGGIIFLAIGAFYIRESISHYANHLSRKVLSLWALIFLLLIAPLVVSAALHPSFIKSLFFVPQQLPHAVDFAKSLGWALSGFIWQSGSHSEFQLGRLAVLNAAQIILLAFGIFAMWSRARSKIYIMGLIVLAAALVAALDGSYAALLLGLPALSLVITAGLRYLHLEWTTVFPRNPLPRGLAIVLMLALVILHIAWGIHYGLTAWPHRLPVI